jgi:hypothetical protein
MKQYWQGLDLTGDIDAHYPQELNAKGRKKGDRLDLVGVESA